MVIYVVRGPEDRILEPVDVLLVASYDVLAFADQTLDLLLASSQIFNHETKVSILLIVLLELLIHGFGALLQVDDLHLSWGDVLVQLLDLEIKHKLELLQLLGTLFEVQNKFFFL